tara:strand:- start:579 stop:950 length:372 start_codon:yes stop_codon:yes gene_type:complete
MNKQLKSLLTCILDYQDAICLDNKDDKEKLINVLTEALTPDDYSEVVTIAEAIFPKAEVDETMMTCEVIIKTGLYNVAAGGEPAHLIEERPPSSREIFRQSEEITDVVIYPVIDPNTGLFKNK